MSECLNVMPQLHVMSSHARWAPRLVMPLVAQHGTILSLPNEQRSCQKSYLCIALGYHLSPKVRSHDTQAQQHKEGRS